MYSLARLAAALRVGGADGAAPQALYLLYAVTQLADALAELREARDRVQHSRSVRAVVRAFTDGSYRPTTDQPLIAGPRGRGR